VQKRKQYKPPKSRLETSPTFVLGNREVTAGEVVKVYGIHGVKFKVIGLVTNTHTGVQWVDVYELSKGVPAQTRAFYPDKIKLLPKRRNKRKVV
jgi:hypothetical protein